MDANGTKIKVILTGATGMVGEGVLLECLEHPAIEQVLVVGRKPYHAKHPRLRECIVPDFLHLERVHRSTYRIRCVLLLRRDQFEWNE